MKRLLVFICMKKLAISLHQYVIDLLTTDSYLKPLKPYLLIQSGRLGLLNLSSRVGESGLINTIAKRIKRIGHEAFLCNFPNPTHTLCMSKSDYQNRVKIVLNLLSKIFSSYQFEKIFVYASSIGAHVFFDALKQCGKLKLVEMTLSGFVSNNPLPTFSNIQKVNLLYGENDLISYISSDGRYSNLLRPTSYSKSTAFNLSKNNPELDIETLILKKENHLLTESIQNSSEIIFSKMHLIYKKNFHFNSTNYNQSKTHIKCRSVKIIKSYLVVLAKMGFSSRIFV